ncbi:MAG: opacity protein-like surface antigen [Rhodothermales bacterium]|jgi:opacity protein-like surface antigen
MKPQFQIAIAIAIGLVAVVGTAQNLPDRPISNPVYTDIAQPKTEINVIYAHHRLPDMIRLFNGTELPLDGDANLIAVQLEYAFNERLSLTAHKDGWLDFNPDSTLSQEEGFGDIALGLKYCFYNNESTAIAVRGSFETTTGSSNILQGNGDGNFSPALIVTCQTEVATFNTVLGAIIPFDDDAESTTSYLSLGAGFEVAPKLTLHGEFNWFHALREGGGEANYSSSQGGTLIPGAVGFEGGDFFNLGAENADQNRDLATVALGARFAVSDQLSLGVGYEIPLTGEENSLFDDRIYVNAQIRF